MTIIFAVGAYVIVSLGIMFQGKVLFDYSRELVGRIGSYFLAIYYAQYFLTVLVALTLSMSTMLKANFLPNTPIWATMLATIPVLGFVAYKGITNVARLFEIYGVIFLIISILVRVMMLTQGDVNHILPLFIPSEAGNYIKAIKDAMFAFLGIEVLLIVPFTAKNGPKAPRMALFTLIFIGIFYILVVESSIMMVGINEITHYKYSLITGHPAGRIACHKNI